MNFDFLRSMIFQPEFDYDDPLNLLGIDDFAPTRVGQCT